MNNCPKCGNPLQAGVTSCPICGTNISSTSTEQNAVKKEVQTATPAPAANTVKVESVASTAPKVENQAVSQEAKTAEPVKVEPVKQEEVAAPVQQATPTGAVTPQEAVTAAPIQPTSPKEPAPQPTPAPQPVQPTVAPIAPTTQNVATPSQTPDIPKSLIENDPAVAQVAAAFKPKPEVQDEPKKKGKKGPLLVLLLVIVVAAGGFIYMNMLSKPSTPSQNSNQPSKLVGATSVSSNGYKFSLTSEWLVNEDGTNVILTNTEETVAIKLDHSASNINNISKEMIENYVDKSSLYKDTKVSELQISAKNAYSIDANYNDLPVQIYFIGGGTNLTLGVTIVYQSADTKNKYEALITEMVGTISYSDESIKAISTMDMYSEIFNTYGGVINSQNTSEEETPSDEENNEENKENQNENTPIKKDEEQPNSQEQNPVENNPVNDKTTE